MQKGWEKLSPEVQNALLHGSAIVKLISDDLDKAPKDVIDTVLAKFTDIKLEDLQAWLPKAAAIFTGIESANSADLYTTIENLQDYFKVNTSSKSWVAQALATIIHPQALIAQVATYAETAYQIIKSFIK